MWNLSPDAVLWPCILYQVAEWTFGFFTYCRESSPFESSSVSISLVSGYTGVFSVTFTLNVDTFKNLDTANHVATSIEIANKNIIKIPIKTLDEVTKNNTPLILKIDVEGYETEVLNGANNLLKNPILKAIIIELNGAGQRYGYDENLIHSKLLLNGFKIFSYNPYSRELVNINYLSKQNTLYIRDYDFVKERIIDSRKIKIQKQLI